MARCSTRSCTVPIRRVVEDLEGDGVGNCRVTRLIRVDSVASQLRQQSPACIVRIPHDALEIDHRIEARLRRPPPLVVRSNPSVHLTSDPHVVAHVLERVPERQKGMPTMRLPAACAARMAWT